MNLTVNGLPRTLHDGGLDADRVRSVEVRPSTLSSTLRHPVDDGAATATAAAASPSCWPTWTPSRRLPWL